MLLSHHRHFHIQTSQQQHQRHTHRHRDTQHPNRLCLSFFLPHLALVVLLSSVTLCVCQPLPSSISGSLVPVPGYYPPLLSVLWNSSREPSMEQQSAFSLVTLVPLFDASGQVGAMSPTYTPQLEALGRQAVVMLIIAAEWINAQSDFFTVHFDDGNSTALDIQLCYDIADSACDPAVSVTNVIDLLAGNPDSLGVLGPSCTIAAQPAALIAAYNNVPIISYAASGDDLSNKVIYPTFFRDAPDIDSTISAMIAIALYYDWLHVAALLVNDDVAEGAAQDLQQQCDANNITLARQTYDSGATDYNSIITPLASLKSTGYNTYLLYGDDAVDCANILVIADSLGMINPTNIWIVHPECDINTVLSQNVTVYAIMQGQLYYDNAVLNQQAPLYQAVVESYTYIVSNNVTNYSTVNIPLPDPTQPILYEALLAFDTALSYFLSYQGLLWSGIFPSRANGPLLTSILNNISFEGITGLVNYSTTTGRRYGIGWDLFQVIGDSNGHTNASTRQSTIILGQIVLEGEKLGNPFTNNVTKVTSSSYPYSVLNVNSSITPRWLGGKQPVDTLLPTTGSSSTDESIAIAVGSILGSLIFLLCCFFGVGLVRRNINRNAAILREAKEEADRRKEEAELADQQKSSFLQTMSHEIRTPMNGVTISAALLSSTQLTAEQLEYVEGITVSTEHLLVIISDILDFSQIESGQMSLNMSVVKLQQIVEQAINIAYRPAFSSHLEIITFVDPRLPTTIVGDNTRLRQILANLLSNSLKFSNAQSGQITIVLCPAGCQPLVHPLIPWANTAPGASSTSSSTTSVNFTPGLYVPDTSCLYTEDRLDEAHQGRVVADVMVTERNQTDGEHADTMPRKQEEHKIKQRLKNLLYKLGKKRQSIDSAETEPVTPQIQDQEPVLDAGGMEQEEKKEDVLVVEGDTTSTATTTGVQPSPTVTVTVASQHNSTLLLQPNELELTRMKTDDYAITINAESRNYSGSKSTQDTHVFQADQLEHLTIECTVEDRGIGISAENQKKLFTRFSQAHSGGEYGGTGLGLAISMFLSQLMGGTMWVCSRLGVGSRFGFSVATVADPRILGSQLTTANVQRQAGTSTRPPGATAAAGQERTRTPSFSENHDHPSTSAASNGESIVSEHKTLLHESPNFNRYATMAPSSSGVPSILQPAPLSPTAPGLTSPHAAAAVASGIITPSAFMSFPRRVLPNFGLSVLIVDDNMSLLRFTASTFISWGCTVYCAHSATAAMAFISGIYHIPVKPVLEEDEASPLTIQTTLDTRNTIDVYSSTTADGESGKGTRLEWDQEASGSSSSLPSKLDVVMIDYHLSGPLRSPNVDTGRKTSSTVKESKESITTPTAIEEKEKSREHNNLNATPQSTTGSIVNDSSTTAGTDVNTGVNGMQLARAIHIRLTRRHVKKVLSRNSNNTSTSFTPPSPPLSFLLPSSGGGAGTTTTSGPSYTPGMYAGVSPQQLRRRLHHKAVSSRGLTTTPRIEEDKAVESMLQNGPLSATGGGLSSHSQTQLPSLNRPTSLPPDYLVLKPTNDTFNSVFSPHLPALILMVGLTDESSLAQQQALQLEPYLTGKLRKPLAEAHMLRCLERIKALIEEANKQLQQQQKQQQQEQQQQQQQQEQQHQQQMDHSNDQPASLPLFPFSATLPDTRTLDTRATSEPLISLSTPRPTEPVPSTPISANEQAAPLPVATAANNVKLDLLPLPVPSSSPSPSPTPTPRIGPSPSPSSGPSAARPQLSTRYPLKLLYAEDNAVNQRLFTRMLSKYGYACDVAENGVMALGMLEANQKNNLPQYDLIFMDMQMPEMDGLECSRAINALYGAQRPVIVAVTANAMEVDKQRCLDAGQDDYLSKPVSFASLESKLSKYGQKITSEKRRRTRALHQPAATPAAANPKNLTSPTPSLLPQTDLHRNITTISSASPSRSNTSNTSAVSLTSPASPIHQSQQPTSSGSPPALVAGTEHTNEKQDSQKPQHGKSRSDSGSNFTVDLPSLPTHPSGSRRQSGRASSAVNSHENDMKETQSGSSTRVSSDSSRSTIYATPLPVFLNNGNINRFTSAPVLSPLNTTQLPPSSTLTSPGSLWPAAPSLDKTSSNVTHESDSRGETKQQSPSPP